jgi:phage/plasmid primase-like uncharacterized protein
VEPDRRRRRRRARHRRHQRVAHHADEPRHAAWDEEIAGGHGHPAVDAPEIKSSSEVYGDGRPHGLLVGVPIAGILGDQQAATFGQACFEPAWRRTPTAPAASC